MGRGDLIMSGLAGLGGAAAGVILMAATAAAAEPGFEIREAVARVTVVPEDRADVAAEVVRGNDKFPLSVSRMGDQVIVDGHLGWRSINCHSTFGRRQVTVLGLGTVDDANMPQVVVHTPRQVSVKAGGAVFGSIGRGAGVTLTNSGCGDWSVANQTGALHVSLAGSGDVHAGAAARTEISLSGSSDVFMRAAHGGLTARISGSGDVTADEVDGPLHANVTGAGDVKVHGGAVSDMKVAVAGSGDVRFGGVAGSLDASIAGSGYISAARVTGSVTKHIAGSGEVSVGH
jgi:hypothetical protein